MAKVIQNEQSIVVEPWWVKGNIVYIGLTMGLLWWVLTTILRYYVVEPIACRDLSTATACVNAIGVSGSIAAVLVAAVGTFLLVRFLQPRPIIIAVATAALLWTLGGVTDGIAWYFTILWALFFYAASYGLFSLVARIKWLWAAIVTAFVIVVGVRLLLAI